MKSLLHNKKIAEILQTMPTVKQLFFSVLGTLVLTFLLLALLSYNPDDPAWSHFGGTQEISNLMGQLGAWVADILQVFFGMGAWWLVFVTAYELIRLWWPHSSVAWQLRGLAYGFLLMLISAMLAQWAISTDRSASKLGGVFGFELQSGLLGLLGGVLTPMFLFALFVIIATLTFNIHWQEIFYRLLAYVLPNQDTPSPKNDEPVPTAPQPEQKAQTTLHIIKHGQDEPTPADTDNHPHALEEFLQTSGLKEEIRLQKHNQPEEFHSTKPIKITTPPTINTTLMGANTTSTDIINTNNASADNTNITTKDTNAMNYPANNNHISDNTAFGTPAQTDTSDNTNQSVNTSPLDTPLDTPVAHAPVANPTPPKNKPALAMPAGKSRAMNTLEYRLSLSAVPELDLLDPPSAKTQAYSQAQLHQLSELLEIKLQEFGINAKVVNAIVGPVITRFEVSLAAGVKVSRVTRIAQDLARSMSMASLRVLPVIAGKPYIGIEVPNRHRQVVSLIELLDTSEYKQSKAGIALAVGVNISGNPIIANLAKAPHMLVAGTTGSGKSVLVNSFLLSMLLKYTPDELRLVLIDPKQVEMANYEEIPHLLTPVVTDMNEAVSVLNWCVNEMERRYTLIKAFNVRGISALNDKIHQAEQMGEALFDPLWQESDSVSVSSPPRLKPLPNIVVVADEFADMLMQLGKTAEDPIVRLAQKARAAGIHLILATQRPVAQVVTGLIKSNVPSRVALRVGSPIDSRLIIEEAGAENMLGHGDMMFLDPDRNVLERAHGAYVKDDEVNRVADAWRERGKPDYIDLTEHSYSDDDTNAGGGSSDDKYYQEAVSFVIDSKKASVSSLQRQFSIGYNRAAKLMDTLEERGVVSKPDNSGKRQILI